MRTVAAAVAVLVVLAGCSAVPVAAPGGDHTVIDRTVTPGIQVDNGSLPVDQNAIYGEVTRMLETDAAPPERVDLEPDSAMGIARKSMPRFYRLVGVKRPAGASRAATALGYVSTPDAVHINDKLTEDPAQLRLTLTHEYVHVVQGRTDAFGRLRRSVPGENTTDGEMVRTSVLEGAAVSVETAYWKRHDDSGTSPAAGMSASYAGTSGARQWIYARYHFGYRYVQAHTDSLAGIDRLYDAPPKTSEELIHELPRGAEPMPPLSVSVQTPAWRRNGTDRQGELFTRVALDTELPSEEAASAAAGWGTDARVELTDGERTGYVWALRWDDEANATEFEHALTDYLDDRATERNDTWTDGTVSFRPTRVGPETVVLTLGDEAFVNNVRVDGTDAQVRVSPANASA
ncbi:MAG: hypothetical protein ABEJ59_05100 [Halanaeroarchaeum sp.]